MTIDFAARYRLCQKLDLECDVSGNLTVWVPASRIYSPVPRKALAFLTVFGQPKTIAEACREIGSELDDEVREATVGYVAAGLLVLAEDQAPPPDTLPVVFGRIASLDLGVKDVAAAIEFYRDGLGAWITQRGNDVTIRMGETELVLVKSAAPSPTCVRFDARHVDFDAAIARLRAVGVDGSLDEVFGQRRFFCKDPSGHRIEILQRAERRSFALSDAATYWLSDAPSQHVPPRHRRDRQPSWVLPFRGPGGETGRAEGLWAAWRQEDFEHLPWYAAHFDAEVAEALPLWAPLPGRCIELGSGPGTFAARLASLGYDVTAVDIKDIRIEQSIAAYARHNPRLHYAVCDVLDTAKLTSFGTFDYAFDRACYHFFERIEDRRRYVDNVAALVRPKGRLFLKAMSTLEPFAWGPMRHSADGIAEMFSPHFRMIESVIGSLESTLTHQPKTVFCVLERREAWESEAD